MSIGLGFELWFVVGCFIADLSMVVSLLMNISSQVNVFLKGDSEEWRSGWFDLIWLDVGMVGYWPKLFLRARVCALLYIGLLYFCCHKCHSGWGWKYFIIPKTTCRFMESDVSFYRKPRVVLLKTTCRFIENIVSFCGKWRVVLDWRSKSCFEDGVLGIFWGRVAAWKSDSVGCYFWNQCKWLSHNVL